MSIWKIRNPDHFPIEMQNAMRAAPHVTVVKAGLSHREALVWQRKWYTFVKSVLAYPTHSLNRQAQRFAVRSRRGLDARGYWQLNVVWTDTAVLEHELSRMEDAA